MPINVLAKLQETIGGSNINRAFSDGLNTLLKPRNRGVVGTVLKFVGDKLVITGTSGEPMTG
jgi:hypothetical protein